jgi:hypothetical protein
MTIKQKALNASLHRANRQKNDEFYTQITDIEKELSNYKEHLKGKVVFCNCDDPLESNFWRYFALNFSHLGLKKLVSTHFDYSEPTYKLELTGDMNEDGKINDDDVVKTSLKQNGDFRSPECVEILKEADIVVTNPPFSLFRDYVAQLIEHDKKFLILGSQNAITYKEIFELIQNNNIWLGVNNGGTKWFQVPDDYEIKTESRKKIVDGKKYFSMGNVVWFTNLDNTRRHESLTLFKTYNPEEYPTYDNYNAINVSKVAEIPVDYEGTMGVPLTFVYKYNPDQFEIRGTQRWFYDESLGTTNGKTLLDGKETYDRIFIKHKRKK